MGGGGSKDKGPKPGLPPAPPTAPGGVSSGASNNSGGNTSNTTSSSKGRSGKNKSKLVPVQGAFAATGGSLGSGAFAARKSQAAGMSALDAQSSSTGGSSNGSSSQGASSGSGLRKTNKGRSKHPEGYNWSTGSGKPPGLPPPPPAAPSSPSLPGSDNSLSSGTGSGISAQSAAGGLFSDKPWSARMSDFGGTLRRASNEDAKPFDRSIFNSVDTVRLGLLGVADAGKTTLFKYFRVEHDEGKFFEADPIEYPDPKKAAAVSEELKDTFRATAVRHALLALSYYLDSMDRLGVSFADPANSSRKKKVVDWIAADAARNPSRSGLDASMADQIKKLWKDKGLKSLVGRSAEVKALYPFIFMDSGPYFLNKLTKLVHSDYIPDEDDVLRLGERTSGVDQFTFPLRGDLYTVSDIGSAFHTTDTWFKYAERLDLKLTALLFVVPMSDFDVVVPDGDLVPAIPPANPERRVSKGPPVTRLQESLNLFKLVCKSESFNSSLIYLCLNKMDLFNDRMDKSVDALKAMYPDFTGSDAEDSANYIAQKFQDIASSHEIQVGIYKMSAVQTPFMIGDMTEILNQVGSKVEMDRKAGKRSGKKWSELSRIVIPK